MSWIDRLHAWTESGLPCALATVTGTAGPAPRKAGARMVVSAEGASEGSVGGGLIEHRCLEAAREAIASGEPRTLHFALGPSDWQEVGEEPGEEWAARASVFVDPILPPADVVAFGGGHIAERLSGLCEAAGLSFCVYDERPEFAHRGRFPRARQVVCAPYRDIAPHIPLSGTSHCVVLTHSHAQDEEVLGQLLRMPFLPYVGMVGSARKVRRILENLAGQGVSPGKNLYAPAGLALGGSLPADIALSILAEIKLVVEGGRPAHLRG